MSAGGGAGWRLSLVSDADGAIAIEAALLAMEEPDPQPLAVSRFEDGPANWRIDAYFANADDLGTAQALIAALPSAAPAQPFELPPTDWVKHVEAMLPPVRAGRFVVHGPHNREAAREGVQAIEIEAGGAFGTAHHGSTEGCLIALSHVVPALKPIDVLDLGTGTGILAIAVARLAPEARILATDIHAPSVVIAAENAAFNGAAGNIRCLEAMGLDHPDLAGENRFDLIVANILAGPLVSLAPGIVGALRPRGRIILSGLLDRQHAEVRHAYERADAVEINAVTRGEWVTMVVKRS